MSGKDLQDERILDHKPYTEFLYTPQDRSFKDMALNWFKTDPAMKPGYFMYNMTRDELINWGFQITASLLTRVHNGEIPSEYISYTAPYMHMGMGVYTHNEMFIPCIQDIGTPEQIAKWAEPARSGKIMGTYAQTEIGHGSDV
jgi:hypothetical protein